MNLRKFLVSFIVLGALSACGSRFPQEVFPSSEVHADAGSVHLRGIDVRRTEVDGPKVRPCGDLRTHQDGGAFDAGVDDATDAGLTVQTTPIVDAGVTPVADAGSSVVIEPGSRAVLVAVLNQAALPAPCSNPGFEVFAQAMTEDPPSLHSVRLYPTGFETSVQIVQGASFPVFLKFFCDMNGDSPIMMGGDSDPACYTASLHTFFSELALHEVGGNVIDMRVEHRAITYIGKTRVSVTAEPVVPATFCIDGGS